MEFWKAHADGDKQDQSHAMRFYSYKVRHMLKLLEITSALILVFWSTTRLPLALKPLAEFVKQSTALLLSTPSVFLIGNAIVVALVARSGSFRSSSDSGSDPYEEFVTESRLRAQIVCSDTTPTVQVASSPDAAVIEIEVDEDVNALEVSKVRCYRRTKSERVVGVSARKELRRLRTENCGMEIKKPPQAAEAAAVDDLNGDDFRRTVEDFIAKQQRFLRDENMDLVLPK